MAARKKAAPVALLIDTNVLLDLILAREPWARDAAALLDACARGVARAYVAAHAVTTVHYLVARALDRRAAAAAISDLLDLVEVVPADDADFRRALTLGVSDFEDAVQVTAHLKCGAKFLVTRNSRDFRAAKVEARTPGEALALISSSSR
ncbi:MAG: PIN domain-containing protein [Gemmatimonas sp.]